MFVEFARLILVTHKPTLSFVNCRLQSKATSETSVLKAMSFATVLDSGKSPVNPPRAITRGG